MIGKFATGGLIGFGAIGIANKKATSIMNSGFSPFGVPLVGPMNQGPAQIKGYGKRGTDANRLQTDGLVQGLFNNRRKQ
jgi:hypothetical protein